MRVSELFQTFPLRFNIVNIYKYLVGDAVNDDSLTNFSFSYTFDSFSYTLDSYYLALPKKSFSLQYTRRNYSLLAGKISKLNAIYKIYPLIAHILNICGPVPVLELVNNIRVLIHDLIIVNKGDNSYRHRPRLAYRHNRPPGKKRKMPKYLQVAARTPISSGSG